MSYIETVYKLVKEAYPDVEIRREQNLAELVHGFRMPDVLPHMLKAANTTISRLRVDIYVKGIVCIEVHGEQHHMPVKFANSILDPEEELRRRQLLDQIKQLALRSAGIASIVIWYNEIKELTIDEIKRRTFIALQRADAIPVSSTHNISEPKFRTHNDKWKAEQKKLAKAKRKKAYQRMKEWKKNNKKD